MNFCVTLWSLFSPYLKLANNLENIMFVYYYFYSIFSSRTCRINWFGTSSKDLWIQSQSLFNLLSFIWWNSFILWVFCGRPIRLQQRLSWVILYYTIGIKAILVASNKEKCKTAFWLCLWEKWSHNWIISLRR